MKRFPVVDMAIFILPSVPAEQPLALTETPVLVVPEVESTSLQPPFQANILIGRDVLDKCTFFYDGPQKTFALTWTDTS